jgi:hypothetical protein
MAQQQQQQQQPYAGVGTYLPQCNKTAPTVTVSFLFFVSSFATTMCTTCCNATASIHPGGNVVVVVVAIPGHALVRQPIAKANELFDGHRLVRCCLEMQPEAVTAVS